MRARYCCTASHPWPAAIAQGQADADIASAIAQPTTEEKSWNSAPGASTATLSRPVPTISAGWPEPSAGVLTPNWRLTRAQPVMPPAFATDSGFPLRTRTSPGSMRCFYFLDNFRDAEANGIIRALEHTLHRETRASLRTAVRRLSSRRLDSSGDFLALIKSGGSNHLYTSKSRPRGTIPSRARIPSVGYLLRRTFQSLILSSLRNPNPWPRIAPGLHVLQSPVERQGSRCGHCRQADR